MAGGQQAVEVAHLLSRLKETQATSFVLPPSKQGPGCILS